MSKSKNLIHFISVGLLFLWAAVLLYFYASERLVHYLPPDGIFRPMVLVAGIGLAILGLFNLATTQFAAACGHDHSHDDGCCGHDHDHDHGHHHHHEGSGHDHSHEHARDHGKCEHERHQHDKECCGHDRHDHAHEHNHSHDHGHGILEESGAMGRLIAILILAAPLALAAVRSPDRYSPNAVINKGLYNPNYNSTARADQFSLKNKAAPATAPAAATAPLPPATVAPAPATAAKASPDAPPAAAQPAAASSTPGATVSTTPPAAATAAAGSQSKSYGSFTLADLEAQVPKSKEGNFILEVPELYYTAGDKEVQSVLAGQPVETVAQVLPEKVNNDDGRRLRIFRMLVQCCAADARPYSIPVLFAEKAPEMKDMTWVKVTGKMGYNKEGDQTVPIIEVKTITETTAPDNAMLY